MSISNQILGLAVQLHTENKNHEAMEIIDLMLQINPNDKDAKLLQMKIYFDINNIEPVLKDLNYRINCIPVDHDYEN
ncbi:MAG: hypothetical protein ABIG69_14795 [Bacteroidota bacterium]